MVSSRGEWKKKGQTSHTKKGERRVWKREGKYPYTLKEKKKKGELLQLPYRVTRRTQNTNNLQGGGDGKQGP